MTTRREQILSQIAATLASTSGVSGRVYRSRVTAAARAETPMIVIEPVNDVAQQLTSLPKLDWTMRVRVVVITRSTTPYTDADSVIESMHSKLMADLTLGGYAIDVQPVLTSFEFLDADQPAGVFSNEYDVKYRTSVADLTVSSCKDYDERRVQRSRWVVSSRSRNRKTHSDPANTSRRPPTRKWHHFFSGND
jgi:hypothetical protein